MAGLVAAVCELALAPPLGPPALSSTSFRCVESASFLPNLFSGSLATLDLDSGVVTCRCWMLPLGLRPGGLEACWVPRGRGRRGGVRRSPVCPLSSRGPAEQEVAGVDLGSRRAGACAAWGRDSCSSASHWTDTARYRYRRTEILEGKLGIWIGREMS